MINASLVLKPLRTWEEINREYIIDLILIITN